MKNARVAMLQEEEGPKVREKGREKRERVGVRVLVQGYLGCLG